MLLKFVFVSLFCVQALARSSNERPTALHIIGGTPAKEGQFPFIVSLKNAYNKDLICGGSLISDRYVLTAGHCITDHVKGIVVGVGSVELDSQEIYHVDEFIVHPDSIPLRHADIALIRLSSPVSLGGNVQTILPYFGNDTLDDKMVTALGWGYTSNNDFSSILMYLNRPIVSNKFCEKRVGQFGNIGPGQICLGSNLNHGMCFGDSGSPLAYKSDDGKTYVVGIVSWGVPCAKGYPDVFTRVSYFAKWIKENMK